jgi:outer membrane lipoprotein-sorting protein
MRIMRTALAALALSAAAVSAPAAQGFGDQTAQSARLTESDQKMVQRVEDYLSGVDTMHAEFLQTSSNGSTARGELWLDRPGKLRFEYQPPHPALIVSNGSVLVYYDRELEQTSYVPISETPLWFLVREDIDMSRIEGYEIAGIERKRKSIRLSVAQEGSATGQPGSLTLVFEDEPLRLKKWRIVDQQGIATEVALLDPRFGIDIDGTKFDFDALNLPDRRRPSNGR